MKKEVSLVLAMVLILGLCLIPVALAEENPVTIKTTGDAYVRGSSRANENKGGDTTLYVRDCDPPAGKPYGMSYLKFPVGSLTGKEIASAKLRLYAMKNDKAYDGLLFAATSGMEDFDEMEITYKLASGVDKDSNGILNPRTAGLEIEGSKTAIPQDATTNPQWIEMDVTKGIQSELAAGRETAVLSIYAQMLETGASKTDQYGVQAMNFYAKEHNGGAFSPELVVTVKDGEQPEPPVEMVAGTDFENESMGEAVPAGLEPYGIRFVTSKPADFMIEKDPENENNQVLHISSEETEKGKRGIYVTVPEKITSGVVSLGFRYRFDSGNSASNNLSVPYVMDGNNSGKVLTGLLAQTKGVTVRNANTDELAFPGIGYADGAWHDVAMDFDMDAQTFRSYFDGELAVVPEGSKNKGGAAPGSSDFVFRDKTATGFQSMVIYHEFDSSFFVDDLRIYQNGDGVPQAIHSEIAAENGVITDWQNVPVTAKSVGIDFNNQDALVFDEGAVTVKKGQEDVPFHGSFQDRRYTIEFDNDLEYGSLYTVTVDHTLVPGLKKDHQISFMTQTRVDRVAIDGADKIVIPLSGTKKVQFQAFGYSDLSGDAMPLPEKRLTYGLKDAVDGVSIDQKTGEATVAQAAQKGSFIMTADYNNGEKTAEKEVRLTEASSITLTGNDNAMIPLRGTLTNSYEVSVLDDEGDSCEIKDGEILYSLSSPSAGVSFAAGVLSVDSGAAEGVVKLHVSLVGKPSVAAEKTVRLTIQDVKLQMTMPVLADACVTGGSQAGKVQDKELLYLRDWGDYEASYSAGYLQVAIPDRSNFIDPDDINSAKIRIYMYQNNKNAPCNVYSARSNVSDLVSVEKKFTYKDAVKADAPGAERLNFYDFGLESAGSQTLVPGSPGWVDIDVTNAVIEAIKEGAESTVIAIYPEIVRNGDTVNPNWQQQLRFRTKDYDNGAYAPTLIIDASDSVSGNAVCDQAVTVSAAAVEPDTVTVMGTQGLEKEGYMTFDVRGFQQANGKEFDSAKLVLTAEQIPTLNTYPFTVARVAPFTGINWENRPPQIGEAVQRYTPAETGDKLELDITADMLEAVSGNGKLAYKLSALSAMNDEALSFAASGEHAPRIEYSSRVPAEYKNMMIAGEHTLQIFSVQNTQAQYKSIWTNDQGQTISAGGERAKFSLKTPYPGVSITQAGKLTVTPSAAAGTVTIKAEAKNGSIQEEFDVALVSMIPQRIKIGGVALIKPDRLTAGQTYQYQYEAQVLDADNIPLDGFAVAWSLEQPVDGVSIDGATGKLTLDKTGSNLPDGTVIGVKAEIDGYPEAASVRRLDITSDTVMKTVSIPVEADTYLQESVKAKSGNTNDTNLLLKHQVKAVMEDPKDEQKDGTFRVSYLKFYLNDEIADGEIVSAMLKLTTNAENKNTAGAIVDQNVSLSLVSDDSWSENAGSFFDYLPAEPRPFLTQPASGQKDDAVTFDVSQQAMAEQYQDGRLSVLLDTESVTDGKILHKFYSKEAGEKTAPQLICQIETKKEIGRIELNQKDGIRLNGSRQEIPLSVTIKDIGDHILPDEEAQKYEMNYYLLDTIPGITLEGNTLKIDASAQEGTIKLKAEIKGRENISHTADIPVYYPNIASVELAGPGKIQVPAEGKRVYLYLASLKDQNGNSAAEEPVFSIGEDTLGVSIDSSTGNLTVEDYAAAGGNVLVVASSKTNPAVKKSMPVTLVQQADDRQHPYLLYSADDLPALRQKITAPPVSSAYDSVKSTADQMTSSQIKQKYIDYDWVVSRDAFYTFDQFSFTTPKNAATMKLQVAIQGQGSGYFDAVSASIEGSTEEVVIQNSSFEDGGTNPTGWTFGMEKAEESGPEADASMQWMNQNEIKMEVAHNGIRSVKLENKNINTVSYLQSPKIAVKQGTNYSANTFYSAPEKLIGKKGRLVETQDPVTGQWHFPEQDDSAGMFMRAVFYDAQGNEIGRHDYRDQTPSGPGKTRTNYVSRIRRTAIDDAMSATAAVYAMTGEAEYASRAKAYLTYGLRDMLWGMYFIRADGYNKKMYDYYEAVHIGRSLKRCAVAYDMIASSGEITPEEDAWIRQQFAWIIEKLRYDTNYYKFTSTSERMSNYNADRCVGLAIAAMTFPDFVDSKGGTADDLLGYASDEIEWMLANSVEDDGMWGESMRYHSAVFQSWLTYGKALQRFDPSRDFLGQEKVKKMAAFYVEFIGPRLAFSTTSQGLAGYPTIADATWREEGVQIAGAAAEYYKDIDPELSAELMYVWNRMGSKIAADIDIEAMIDFDPTLPEKRPNLTSVRLPYTGYTLFRKNYDVLGSEYLMLMPAQEHLTIKRHDHNDRGSFQIFANSVPISLDPGVGGYFTDAGLYRATRGHNVVQFYNPYSENPDSYDDNSSADGATRTNDIYTSQEYDYTDISITSPSANRYNRHLAFVKNGFDAFIVWDDVDADTKSRFNLYMASTGFRVDGNKVTADCYGGMQLETTFLNQESLDYSSEWKPLASNIGLPEIAGGQNQQVFYNYREAGQDHLALMYPKKNTQDGLKTVQIATGSPVARAYRVEKGSDYFLIATNESDMERSITLSNSEPLRDVRTGSVTAAGATVTIAAHSMMVLMPEAKPQPQTSTLQISGNSELSVPTAGSMEYSYSALAFDQNGDVYETAGIRFELTEAVTGVTVTADGVLRVDSTAPVSGNVRLAAVCGDVRQEMTIKLNRAAGGSKVASLRIIGSSILTIPSAGSTSCRFELQQLDEAGTVLSGHPVVWELLEEVPGVTINKTTGELTVSAETRERTVLKIAVTSTENVYASALKNVVLMKPQMSGVKISGGDQLAVERGLGGTKVFTATVTDQQGAPMAGHDVLWSLDGAPDGVTVNNGLVAAPASVEIGTTFYVVATAKENEALRGVQSVTVVEKRVQAVSVSGPVEIWLDGDRETSYTATVTDNNGGISSQSVTWRLENSPANVSISGGVLSTKKSSTPGDIIISAECGGVTGRMTVHLRKKAEINTGGGNGGGPGGGSGSVTPPVIPPVPGGTPGANPGEPRFADVPKGHWAAGDVEELAARGAISGREDGSFDPDGTVTRAEFVKILVLALGITGGETDDFSDVLTTDWYYPYVKTAKACGLVSGLDENTFGGETEISREQMAVILDRALQMKNVVLEAGGVAFTDSGDISQYAADAVGRLSNAGIINGVGEGRFAPRDNATRAQTAKMINQVRKIAGGAKQ